MFILISLIVYNAPYILYVHIFSINELFNFISWWAEFIVNNLFLKEEIIIVTFLSSQATDSNSWLRLHLRGELAIVTLLDHTFIPLELCYCSALFLHWDGADYCSEFEASLSSSSCGWRAFAAWIPQDLFLFPRG